jgi:hypothetical protein
VFSLLRLRAGVGEFGDLDLNVAIYSIFHSMRTHRSRFLEDSRDGVRQVILAVFVWFWCVVYTTHNDISLLTPEENRTLPDMRRYSSGILCLLFPAFDCLSTFTCLAPNRRSLGVSGGDPWGLIDAIVSLDSTQSFQCSRPCSLQSSFLLSATMIVVFALTGVCEGNGQSVGVAEAFAERRYNGLSEAVLSAFVHSTHPPEQDVIPQ